MTNNPTAAIIGRNIKRHRMRTRLTQNALAAKLQRLAAERPDLFRATSQGNLSNLESDTRPQMPTVPTLQGLALVLGTTAAELLKGCDELLVAATKDMALDILSAGDDDD